MEFSQVDQLHNTWLELCQVEMELRTAAKYERTNFLQH